MSSQVHARRAPALTTALALACAALVCAAAGPCRAESERTHAAMLTLSEKDDGRSVNLKIGDDLEVTLPENATTGYRWAVDHIDGSVVDLGSTQPHYPSGGAVGSGGRVTFVFRGDKPGTGAIALKQWRPWEGDSSVVGRFRVEVRVLP
jgi:inhibitor of cysteine peptidase